MTEIAPSAPPTRPQDTYPPYEGPSWIYEVHGHGAEIPVGYCRDYELARELAERLNGVRVGTLGGIPVNSIDEITVTTHDGCWSPAMRCNRIISMRTTGGEEIFRYPHKCRDCDSPYVNRHTSVFKLQGTCKYQ